MRKSTSDPEIIMSPLYREISGDGTKIRVDIYRGEDESGWILEVIEKDGIRSFLEGDFEVKHRTAHL